MIYTKEVKLGTSSFSFKLSKNHHLRHYNWLRYSEHGAQAKAEAERGTEDGRGSLTQFVGNASDHQRGDADSANFTELFQAVGTLHRYVRYLFKLFRFMCPI